jgi:predicted TIM-barrel enzyme
VGKIGQQTIRLVGTLPNATAPAETLIWCPFLAGLDPAVALWLGPLAWHDCNATLLAALERLSGPARGDVYAGVFCADPFRAPADLFATLRRAGIAGVANLPSTSFLDGELGQTLAALSLGPERELAFLRQAAERGFRIAACVSELRDAEAMCEAGADLILTHAGPPLPGQLVGRSAGWNRSARRLAASGARILSLYDLTGS